MSYEISNIYTVDTAARFPLGTVSFDNNTGWRLKYVQFSVGFQFDHGDAIKINAANLATPRTLTQADGVVIHKGDGVNAVGAAKYGWVACRGSVNPVWVNVANVTADTGSSGEPTGVNDFNNFPLTYQASGNAYDPRGKMTVENTLSGNITGSTAEFTSANLNATMVKIENVLASKMRGVSAVSAFTATGNEQSAYLRKLPANYFKLVAANTAQVSASGAGISASGISAFIKSDDIFIWSGDARAVTANLTAAAGYSVSLSSGTNNSAAVTGTDALPMYIGKMKVLAEFL